MLSRSAAATSNASPNAETGVPPGSPVREQWSDTAAGPQGNPRLPVGRTDSTWRTPFAGPNLPIFLYLAAGLSGGRIMVHKSSVAALLGKTALFGSLPYDDLLEVADQMRAVAFGRGQT